MTDFNCSSRPRNLCWGLTVAGVILLGIALFILKNGQSSTMVPVIISGINTIVLGLMGAWRCSFARNLALEQESAQIYRQEHGKTELFQDADDAARLAARANQQYIKYAVPILTILLGLAEIFTFWGVWKRWNQTPAFLQAPNPMPLAILCICCCIAVLIAGSYFLGASREPGCRWLRPSCAWLFLTGILFLAGGTGLFLEFFEKNAENADIFIARCGMILIFLLAIELVFAFIIEFYRPRMPGEEERPLPESRILALFTEPGGVARNVAASLDYQFGFQVSEVWFYRFLERTVLPLLFLMAIALWLQTCIIVVGTEEQGIKESFGKVLHEKTLSPGLYFKLPTPFERIIRFPVEHIQTITIGGHEEEEEEDEHGHGKEKEEDHEKVVLWSTQHADEETNFIVALPAENGNKEDQTSIGLLAAHIPLYYKVNDIYRYLYGQANPAKTLQNLATRELVRYLAHSNFNDLLGADRQNAGDILKERIQKAADDAQLGIEIVFCSLAGLHPPVAVGEAYDQVMASKERRETLILQAEAFAAARKPEAEAQRQSMLDEASAYRMEKEQVSRAEANRFQQQLRAYLAAPELFRLNSFLELFQTEAGHLRKYLITSSTGAEVFSLDLQKKVNAGLLELNLEEGK